MNLSQPNPEAYKEQLFGAFGRLGRAVSSPRRLELLDLLCQAERTVEDLTHHTGMTASNVSQHLSVLKESHLVASRKEGLFVYYRLADPVVGEFWQLFRKVALQRMADARELVSTHTHDPDEPAPLSLTELDERIKKGTAVLLDVRPEVEFAAGHLPGAISIPLEQLEHRLDEIPREQEVVTYCRGHYCLMALEAVRLLRSKGFAARRTEEGIPEWKASGHPVEVTS